MRRRGRCRAAGRRRWGRALCGLSLSRCPAGTCPGAALRGKARGRVPLALTIRSRKRGPFPLNKGARRRVRGFHRPFHGEKRICRAGRIRHSLHGNWCFLGFFVKISLQKAHLHPCFFAIAPGDVSRGAPVQRFLGVGGFLQKAPASSFPRPCVPRLWGYFFRLPSRWAVRV